MNAEHQRRALEIFDAVIELPPAEQAERVDALCAGDDLLLRAQVMALLRADAQDFEPFTGNAVRWSEALASHAPLAESPMSGRTIGAWRIVDTLGHGGMGAVYAVERNDGAYEQRAALKLIRGASDSPAARQRFLRERQALARLQHPNIATLLDGGFSPEGDPWFVMELIDGIAIDQWCDERGLDPRARVELFLQALAAVQFAHRNLIVHSDLKPSNLLVDAQGRVKLLDFGIAKELENLQATVTSDRMLTFAFASPEQLGNEPITTATDLWQLGIVLQQLLVGSHPFGLKSSMPLPQQLRLLECEPETLTKGAARATDYAARRRGCASPATLAAVVRGDLANIVQGCLRRDPAARYSSVEALADDLRRWMEQRPLRISPPDAMTTARLWLRRNRLVAIATAAVTTAVIGGAALSLWQAKIASTQARIAQTENARAQAAIKFLTEAFAAAAPERALDTTVSVKHLLDNARDALDRPGAVDPIMRQPVQRMLGRLYGSLNDDGNAMAMFAAGIPEESPRSREEALALADDLVMFSELLAAAEKLEQALATADRAVRLREQFAHDDPEQQFRALAHQNLAHLHAFGAEACEARARRALELAARLPNPPADVVLGVYYDLAALADLRGSGEDTLAVTEEGLAFADRYGVAPESPHRATLQRYRVHSLNNLGRLVEAESVVRASIAAAVKTGGSGQSRFAVLQSALSETLHRQGRYRESLETMREVERLDSPTEQGPRNRSTLLVNLGFLTMQLGDYDEALRIAEQGMAILNDSDVPITDPYRLDNERAYARILSASGKLEPARALFQSVVERTTSVEPGEWQKQVRLATWLAPVLQQLGDARGSDAAIAKARTLLSANGVATTDVLFASLRWVEGRIAQRRGDLDTAESLWREALPVLTAIPNRTDAAIAQAEYAAILAARGDHASAQRYLDQALPVLRNAVLPTETARATAEALERKLRGR